jgi:hypothetical protein
VIDAETSALFFERVIPAYRGFVDVQESAQAGESRDLNAGLEAALAIYHFREQLTGSAALEIATVVAKCPDYALCRDVADIAKHDKLNRPSAQLHDSSAIAELTVVTIYQDALGEYRDTIKSVELTLPDRTTRDLAAVLTNSINFWSEHLNRSGIQPRAPKFAMPAARTQPVTRLARRRAGLHLSIVRGLRFRQNFRIQRYNYQTKSIEPLDMTGMQARLRIHKAKYEISLTLRKDATGAELTTTVPLTPEESDEFAALNSDEEQRAFLSKLIGSNEKFGDLIAETRLLDESSQADGA